jgi:signal transduction histidine kinase
MNNQNMAFMYFEQALKYATESGYTFNIALCSRKLAELYIAQKYFDKAFPLLEKSIQIGTQTNNFEILKKGYFAMYNLFAAKGEHKKALDNYLLSDRYADSINVSMTNKQLLDMQLNFEMANQQSIVKKISNEVALLKKEKQIIEMKETRRTLIIIVLLISMLLVTSIGILYYNRYQLKHKAAAQLQEKIDIIEKTNERLVKSEEELQQINSTKDKFFSIIAHDIKNPLGGLITITDLVKADFDSMPDKEKRELFEIVNKSSHQLYSLLENLLHWSRSQTGRIPVKPVELKINELVESNFELLKPNAERKNIMTLNLCNQNHKVNADKEMITLVIRNLISNAVKFTREGGKISVSSALKEGMVEICIEDNGIGISKTDIQKLFRIDVQFSQNGTNNETGTGLGLILCKEFIQKNQGKIRVESEPGVGSKFIFSLPAFV